MASDIANIVDSDGARLIRMKKIIESMRSKICWDRVPFLMMAVAQRFVRFVDALHDDCRR